MRASRILCVAACLAALASLPRPGFAQSPNQDPVPGVSQTRILFGQSAAFSGPVQSLGRNMRLGIATAFAEINAAGGVFGRKLELISLDDAYEPEAAIINTTELIRNRKVFALIGGVGTRTARAVGAILTNAGAPYIAPLSGAAFLRRLDQPNVINLRASYEQETKAAVDYLVNQLGFRRIGIVHQNDSFGREGLNGATLALERYGLAPVASGAYPRNTTAIKSALLAMRNANPEAIILVAEYKPAAAMIFWSRKIGFNPVFAAMSFVGGRALARELGPQGVGVYVTQVTPLPGAAQPPVVAAYRKALATYAPDATTGFISLEGYLAGRLTAFALGLCGKNPARRCFLDELKRTGAVDLGGFQLNFGPTDNQGSDKIFLTVIGEDGDFHPVETGGGKAPQ